MVNGVNGHLALHHAVEGVLIAVAFVMVNFPSPVEMEMTIKQEIVILKTVLLDAQRLKWSHQWRLSASAKKSVARGLRV